MAKKTAAEKPIPKRKVQAFMPGTEPVKNDRIHAAAEAYYDVMSRRVALSKKEKIAKNELLSVLISEKETGYIYGDLKVFMIDGEPNVKVKIGEDKKKKKGKKKGEKPEEDDAD